eukprot:1819160-Amphidinium_carterae.1
MSLICGKSLPNESTSGFKAMWLSGISLSAVAMVLLSLQTKLPKLNLKLEQTLGAWLGPAQERGH